MEGYSLKQQLRAEFRERRRSLDSTRRHLFEKNIHQALLALAEDSGAKTLAAYLAFDGEVDLSPALKALSERGLTVTVPVISGPPGEQFLRFQAWSPTATVRKNCFGIDEPQQEAQYALPDLDLVLLPLVAWDDHGRRLGMGAGYYDKALAPFRHSVTPLRVGVAFGLQQAPELPEESWDIPLHHVMTENGLFTCVP